MQLIQSINHKKIPTNSSFNQSITKNTNIPLIQSINNNIPTYSSFNQSITKNTCSRQEVAKIGEGIQKKNLYRNLSQPFTTWSSFDINTSEIFFKSLLFQFLPMSSNPILVASARGVGWKKLQLIFYEVLTLQPPLSSLFSPCDLDPLTLYFLIPILAGSGSTTLHTK